MSPLLRALLPLLVLLGSCGNGGTPPAEQPAEGPPAASVARQEALYPLTTCLVCEAELDGSASPVWIEERLTRVCGAACAEELRRDPAPRIEALDRAAIAAQLADYPTDQCPIGESPIDSMGGPLDVIVDGRLVRFCCEGCVKPFEREKERYFAALDALAAERGR